MLGFSSALLVSVPIRSSVGWNIDSGCAPVVCTIAAIGAGAPGRPAMVALRRGLHGGWYCGKGLGSERGWRGDGQQVSAVVGGVVVVWGRGRLRVRSRRGE